MFILQTMLEKKHNTTMDLLYLEPLAINLLFIIS